MFLDPVAPENTWHLRRSTYEYYLCGSPVAVAPLVIPDVMARLV
ncbi:hypothetical protein Pla52o_32230 [Novipirellula galeiformis]|uniref:Uncharacterized protein n=1 Tax=Novipirellula galeiformis TaxID=2528004 RepID=A0A5C6CHG2_9BACT|nr:hypothetical protein Pla52o_32230 [Novipirellula galeiformis]